MKITVRKRALSAGLIFTTLLGAGVLTESWRRTYKTVRPHSALGYRPTAPGAVIDHAEITDIR